MDGGGARRIPLGTEAGRPVVNRQVSLRLRSTDETRLVDEACAGSARARGELFRRHWDAAWARAYALTGRRADAEDVVQDAFERAFGALERFDRRASFRTWLLRIVTNRALDLLKGQRRQVPLGEHGVEWVDAVGRRGVLQGAVARLSPDRRLVVVMRYWLDLAPGEIAEHLGVPEGTVNSRLARALAELRSFLEVDDVA
jgi:RNA polymerase sigma-70 factor (ECF subfamily)